MVNKTTNEKKKLPILIWLIGFLVLYWIEKQIFPWADQNGTSSQTENAKSEVIVSPEPVIQQPKPSLSPKSSPMPSPKVSYDESLGNNPVAAKYSEDIMNITNKAVPNTILEAYMELSPEDMKGEDEETYKKRVTSAFFTLKINNAYWVSFDEDSKKDVVASFVVSVGNIFPGAYPHIIVNNGVRTVAEGEYNWLKTEPKVTLK